MNDWNAIRSAYKRKTPLISEVSSERRRGKINPYFLDWLPMFTPIEEAAWNCIRHYGVPLYPQVPALRYFIDFANPHFKIGLELDGKAFHDAAKDKRRDQELYDREGWRIFRVTGSEAFRQPPDIPDEDDEEYEESIRQWLRETCDGVVKSIDEVYFRQNYSAYDSRCFQSLDCHRLANFELFTLAEMRKPPHVETDPESWIVRPMDLLVEINELYRVGK